jgi:chromosome segregation ATPase
MVDDTQKVTGNIEDAEVESSEDLAMAALSQADDTATKTDSDETEQSDKLADTLSHLQNLLERYAMELENVSTQIKEKRESLKGVFENDSELGAAEEEAKLYSQQAKARKAALQSSPVAVGIKNQLAELSSQKKEIEETISNHLLNYYGITRSKSFDTSDGDQWEFDIRAKVKSRKK